MPIKALVTSVGGSRVAVNARQSTTVRHVTGDAGTPVKVQNAQRDTVRYIAGVGLGGADGLNRIAEMLDVDMSDADTNETLVYNESDGTFVVKEIPVINGGTF